MAGDVQQFNSTVYSVDCLDTRLSTFHSTANISELSVKEQLL